MSELTEFLDRSDLKKNPEEIASMIIALAKELDSCKGDLAQAKERGVWKRLTSNNTRDLAQAIIKQNDTISMFLNIVQSLILLNLNNVAILSGVMEKLSQFEIDRGESSNRYIRMAKEYIQESIRSAQRTTTKIDTLESRLETTKIQLIENAKIDEKQDQLLVSLRSSLHEQHTVDLELEKNVEEIRMQVLAKNSMDEQQTSSIRELQDFVITQASIDSKQTENINKLVELHALLDSKISSLQAKLNQDAITVGPTIHYASLAALALSIAAIAIAFLK